MWLLRARHASIERSIRSHYAVIRRLFSPLANLTKIQGAEHRLFKDKTHARSGGFVDGRLVGAVTTSGVSGLFYADSPAAWFVLNPTAAPKNAIGAYHVRRRRALDCRRLKPVSEPNSRARPP
jgi:hypothetical protein